MPSSPEQGQSSSTTNPGQNISNSTSQIPTTPVRQLPPVPPFPNSSATSTSHVPDSLPPSQAQEAGPDFDDLPVLLLQLLNNITTTLRTAFSDHPPHTIQRLAELVLYPRKHYKTLPAWLRAVDRVVSVSSSADIFPLSDAPPMVNGVNGDGGGGILWNNSADTRNGSGYDSSSLGSDESLGGALLTPIPWLKNDLIGSNAELRANMNDDNIEGNHEIPTSVNGNILVPEREDGAVTQGELMRMEQEAGVIPVNLGPQTTRTMAGAEDDVDLDDESEEMPHARGPDVVGAIDIGKVDGRDVQVRIGSPPQVDRANVNVDPSNAQEIIGGIGPETSETNEEGFEFVRKAESDNQSDDMILDANDGTRDDDDGDIVLVDADGKMDDEPEQKEDRPKASDNRESESSS